MEQTPASILGPGGLIARRLERYEHREQQLLMADAVQGAIRDGKHLIVEAGTGVGKSFAYLVPTILAVTAQQKSGRGKAVIISTQTISLQEQLIGRDLPFLNAVLPLEFSAVLAKGRGNYVSLRRLKRAGDRSNSLLGEPREFEQLEQLRKWSITTTEGSLTDLDFRPVGAVWDEVKSEQGNCLSRRCPTYDACYFYRARRRVWNAQIVVVNHALFFADLALRREGANVLPDYDVVIFDEAHTLEQTAAEHLGISVSSGQVSYTLNRLYNERRQKGLLVQHDVRGGAEAVVRLKRDAEDLFEDLRRLGEENSQSTGRFREPPEVDERAIRALRTLSADLRTHAARLRNEEQRMDVTSSSDRLDGLAAGLTGWVRQSIEDAVYWTEASGRGGQNLRLVCAPVDVGPALQELLYSQVRTVVMTSATLTVGRRDFRFFRQRIGLTGGDELSVGSPFDYASQARLVLADGMPDPGERPADFERAAVERIRMHLTESDGGTFVLFTSYRMLRNVASRLTRWLAECGMPLYCQGADLDRSAMLDRFRQDRRAVLFGTESFWQGVDVPGDALRQVIITKLPFSVPDQPLLEARLERIREQGGNPFMDYQVPEAAIKLRQGFGRLIRTRDDTGQVVILDPRIRTKRYGRWLLEGLPECQVVVDGESSD